jgi:hypothetical protein
MNPSFEQTLVEVWRQALVENASAVELDGKRYPVRITPRKGLRQVDFVLDGNEIRGLEQNPDTKSRWAQLARSGKKVMQFLSRGRYVAVVVDGKVISYGRGADGGCPIVQTCPFGRNSTVRRLKGDCNGG